MLLFVLIAHADSGLNDTGLTDTGAWVSDSGDTGLQFQDLDGDGALAYEDCDDNDASVYPIVWGRDADDDGFGDVADSLVLCGTAPPPGYVRDITDCDDGDSEVNPGQTEVASNQVDDDCDGEIDEGSRPPSDSDPTPPVVAAPQMWFCGTVTSTGTWLGGLGLLAALGRRRSR